MYKKLDRLKFLFVVISFITIALAALYLHYKIIIVIILINLFLYINFFQKKSLFILNINYFLLAICTASLTYDFDHTILLFLLLYILGYILNKLKIPIIFPILISLLLIDGINRSVGLDYARLIAITLLGAYLLATQIYSKKLFQSFRR